MKNRICSRISSFFGKTKNKVSNPISTEYSQLVHSQRGNREKIKPLPVEGKRNILVTAALPYVNNKPHLGNIIGAVLSGDVFSRYSRLMGHNTLYICGTDQYGTASQVKAIREKTTPREICDRYHQIHKHIYDWFDIDFNHFGRTSQPIHQTITQDIFQDIHQAGLVQQKKSVQWYCGNCDLFLADRFIEGICSKCQAKTRGDQCDACGTIFDDVTTQIIDVECSICREHPSLVDTDHLYLKLPQQTQNLKQWLEGDTMDRWSKNAKGITKGWLKNKSQDRCISRDLKWGVRVPLRGYEKKVFYVWFQAPLGYISITADYIGEQYKLWWQRQSGVEVELRQFMGKDNVIFHSIMCPISLRAGNKNWILPTHISATEHLMYQGGKFSKSKNIGIFGDQCIQTGIPVQYWRFYLLRIRPEYFDCQFDWQDFAQKCNKELLNSIGNLVHRVLKYTYTKHGSKVLLLQKTHLGEDQTNLLNILQQKFGRYKVTMQKMLFSQGIMVVLQVSHVINEYIAKVQFWKHPKQTEKLAFLLRIIRLFSILMSPFMPSLSAKINFLLGCSNTLKDGQLLKMQNCHQSILICLEDSHQLKQPIPLIEQITEEKVKHFRTLFGSHKN